MQLTDFLGKMTPVIYESLKQAVELGRWPNGVKLSDQEREASLQALIAWEYIHLEEEQRSGFMPVRCKNAQASRDDEPASILRFKDS